MTRKGDEEWVAMTTANVGRIIAICLNDVVISVPNVNEPIKGAKLKFQVTLPNLKLKI